jgi:hypothetical protein
MLFASRQPLDHRLIVGAPAVAHDAGLGAALLGIPGVLGKLQVGHHTAVGAPLLGLTQIHVPNPRDRIPKQSSHCWESMYLGICAGRYAHASTNQRLTKAAGENVTKNCQTRVERMVALLQLAHYEEATGRC